MKALLVLLIAVASPVALAAGNDVYVVGTYATYSNYCGIHIEKDGENVLTVQTPNPLQNVGCNDGGLVTNYVCQPNGDCVNQHDASTPGHVITDTLHPLSNQHVVEIITELDKSGKVVASKSAEFFWWRAW